MEVVNQVADPLAPVLSAGSAGATDALDEACFQRIAEGVRGDGYVVLPDALPRPLADALWMQAHESAPAVFRPAAIGRLELRDRNRFVRTDEIAWIEGHYAATRDWLAWTERLRLQLNRSLLLGLFSFESHFAHYAPGAFYRRHLDAFRGEANRVLSLVAYLNHDWAPDDGGELVIYRESATGAEPLRVTPAFGTLVAFLSEEFPHEVLPARRDRYSIAGWYRVNGSVAGRVDPPL